MATSPRLKPQQTAALISEADLQTSIVEAAQLLGWYVYYARKSAIPGRNGTWRGLSPKGWPDLTLIHPIQQRVIWAELKALGKRPTKEQEQWLTILRQAGQEAYLWTPTEWLDGKVTALLQAHQ